MASCNIFFKFGSQGDNIRCTDTINQAGFLEFLDNRHKSAGLPVGQWVGCGEGFVGFEVVYGCHKLNICTCPEKVIFKAV